MNSKRAMAALLGMVIGFTAWAAQAQPWPSARPVQIIVPFGAGGLTDIVARVLAQRMSEALGQSVIVMNLPGGGGGIVGTETAVRAKPDGYTLYLGANSMATYPHVRPANNPLTFSPEHDLVPIGGVSSSAHVFVVHKSVGVRTLAELVALAKQKPGALTYASAGVGSTTHLPPALFAHEVGIDMIHVPYKGAAPALVDSMAGRVSLFAVGYSGAIDQPIKDGTLIPLAVTSAQRLPFLPDVPTMIESGYPDMVFPIWLALFAPKGTPPAIVSRLSSELEKMTKEPEFQRKLYAQGNPAAYVPPDRLGKMVSDDIKRLGVRMKATGINFGE
jgi:tripartite-type tricarboxylate transporter receptor subunit TctC